MVDGCQMHKQPIEKSLKEIYFYLTDICNLKCCHCWIEPAYQTLPNLETLLDTLVFKSILEQGKALGLEGVKFTGGEPLLHPYIKEFIEICASENIAVTIETNGTLCDKNFVDDIAPISNIALSVSLDGATSSVHEKIRGVQGSFALAIQGIKNLVEADIRPQIIMTLMQHNIEQVDKLVSLAVDLNASSVAFNILQPMARGYKLHKAGLSVPIEKLIAIGLHIENNLSNLTSIPIYYGHPPAFRPIHRLYEFDNDGCSSCGIKNIVSVLPDGSYAICGIGKSQSEFRLGNAVYERLDEVWLNSSQLNEIRDGLPNNLEGICHYCIMKNMCLGKCVVQNYSRGSSLWKPYWYCQEAFEKGLFPASRLSEIPS